MFKPGSIQSHLSIKDKILSLDLILFFSVLTLGIISFFAMYSTDAGEFAYHTKKPHNKIYCFFYFIHSYFFLKQTFGTIGVC